MHAAARPSAFSLLSPAALTLHDAASPSPQASGAPTRAGGTGVIHLDDGLLPGPDGWFLAAVHVLEPGEVDLEVRLVNRGTDTGPARAASLVSVPDWGLAVFDPDAPLKPMLEAAARGASVSCCLVHPQTLLMGPTEAEGTLGGALWVQDTLWLGLVAVGWKEVDEYSVSLVPRTARVELGEVRTGTQAYAADLVDGAHREGVNVRLGGSTLAGTAGDARVSFAPRGTGLLVVNHWASGDVTGRLRVRAGDDVLRDGPIQDNAGRAVFAGPGILRVELDDLRVPGQAEQMAGGQSTVSVTALWADLDVPFKAREVFEDALPW